MQKFNHGGREEKALHVGALPHALHFFAGKDVFDMTAIERMVSAGMSEAAASETAMWYMAQGDDDGLESYVTALEALKDMEARRGIRTLQS